MSDIDHTPPALVQPANQVVIAPDQTEVVFTKEVRFNPDGTVSNPNELRFDLRIGDRVEVTYSGPAEIIGQVVTIKANSMIKTGKKTDDFSPKDEIAPYSERNEKNVMARPERDFALTIDVSGPDGQRKRRAVQVGTPLPGATPWLITATREDPLEFGPLNCGDAVALTSGGEHRAAHDPAIAARRRALEEAGHTNINVASDGYKPGGQLDQVSYTITVRRAKSSTEPEPQLPPN